MNKRSKFMVSITILLIMILSMVSGQIVFATGNTNINLKITVQNKLSSLARTMGTIKDEKNMIIYLSNLTCISLWNDLANSNTAIGMTESNLEPYQKYMSSSVDVFNTTYGTIDSTNKYSAMTITNTDISKYSASEGSKVYASGMSTTLVQASTSKVNSIFSTIKVSMDSATDETAKQKILTDNSQVILTAYRMVERINDEYGVISGISSETSSKYTKDITPLTKVITDSDYSAIVKFAQDKIALDINSNPTGEFVVGTDPQASFLSVNEFEGSSIDLVNEAYLKCLAASAIYKPFDSVTGGEDFVKALNSLTGDDKNIVNEYNKLKSRKKPLYRRDMELLGNEGKGDAKRISIKDFFTQISDYSSGVLVTFKGAFVQQADGDSYSMVNGDGTKYYEGTGQSEKVDNSTPTPSTATPSIVSQDGSTSEGPTDSVVNNGVETPLTATMSDTELMSEPVFSYGENGDRRAQMNTLLMHNIVQDAKLDDVEDKLSSSFLYINPFGDIVLSDDTVVIPASANASYYSEDSLYNPATAAFMNSYPKVSNTEEYFNYSERDTDKMIIFAQVDKDAESGFDLKQDSTYPTLTGEYKCKMAKLSDNQEDIKFWQVSDSVMTPELSVYNNGSEKIRILTTKVPKFEGGILDAKSHYSRSTTNNSLMLIPDSGAILSQGVKSPLFPLNSSNTANYDNRCKLIAKAVYDELTLDSSGSYSKLTNGRIKIDYLTEQYKIVCQGNSNIARFVKNSQAEYLEDNEIGMVTKLFYGLTEKILATVGTSSGVIGIKNGYQDYFFSKFINFMDSFLPAIMAIVFIIIVAFYARRQVSLIAGVFYGACILVITFIALNVFPIYVPVFLNGLVDDSSANIGYKALIMREEQYINPYDEEIGKNASGDFSLNSSSVNLYRFDREDFKDLAYQYNVTKDMISSGEPVVVDSKSGVFIQGDTLKLNLDRFLESLSIKGDNVSDGLGSNYQITAEKNFSNSMDYYTPYYLVVDGFVDKLNKFNSVMRIPSTQLPYGNGLYKDSFSVSSYLRSDLFINNEDLTKLSDSFEGDTYDLIVHNFGDNNIDCLGLKYALNDYVVQNYEAVSKTLWFQTMQRNGYYDEAGMPIPNKITKLITYVNNTTREFLLDNRGQMSYVSDENLIKVTSLFALCQLNVAASDFTDVLYPQSLNYEELTLTDALLPVLTKDYDRYVAKERNIVQYISKDFGIVGLIFFSIACLLAWIISGIMRLSLPLMYFLLLISIIAKFLLRKNEMVSVLFKGYLKIFISIFISYLVFCFATTWSYKISDSSWCLAILSIVYAIVLTVMSGMLFSLLSNISDFGNTKVTAMLGGLGSRIKDGFKGKFRGNYSGNFKGKFSSISDPSTPGNKRKRFLFDSDESDYYNTRMDSVGRRREEYRDYGDEEETRQTSSIRKKEKRDNYRSESNDEFRNRFDHFNL